MCCIGPIGAGTLSGSKKIASRLRCNLSLLLTAKILAPGDAALVLGALDQAGVFTFNGLIPVGEMEEYMQDVRGYLEEAKLAKIL